MTLAALAEQQTHTEATNKIATEYNALVQTLGASDRIRRNLTTLRETSNDPEIRELRFQRDLIRTQLAAIDAAIDQRLQALADAADLPEAERETATKRLQKLRRDYKTMREAGELTYGEEWGTEVVPIAARAPSRRNANVNGAVTVKQRRPHVTSVQVCDNEPVKNFTKAAQELTPLVGHPVTAAILHEMCPSLKDLNKGDVVEFFYDHDSRYKVVVVK